MPILRATAAGDRSGAVLQQCELSEPVCERVRGEQELKLLMGGSPCTHWSIAQTKNRETEPSGRWNVNVQSSTAPVRRRMEKMDYKDKIKWLRRYQDEKRRELYLQDEIEQLRTEAERVTPLLTGVPGTGCKVDRMPKAVERIVQVQQQLEAQINCSKAVRSEVVEAIDAVQNERQREILHRRYILGQRWEKIAVEMKITLRWVYRLHEGAIFKLAI